jgi:hypothetical protein
MDPRTSESHPDVVLAAGTPYQTGTTFDVVKLRDYVTLSAVSNRGPKVFVEGKVLGVAHMLDSLDQEHIQLWIKAEDHYGTGWYSEPLWSLETLVRDQ